MANTGCSVLYSIEKILLVRFGIYSLMIFASTKVGGRMIVGINQYCSSDCCSLLEPKDFLDNEYLLLDGGIAVKKPGVPILEVKIECLNRPTTKAIIGKTGSYIGILTNAVHAFHESFIFSGVSRACLRIATPDDVQKWDNAKKVVFEEEKRLHRTRPEQQLLSSPPSKDAS